MQILIRDVPENVAKQLDIIVSEENYSSRNQLIVEILERYANIKEQAYVDALTPVVRTMIESEIHKLGEASDRVLRSTELVLLKLLKSAQKIDTYMTDDFLYEEED